VAHDYIEYEFTRKDGTRVDEIVSREDAAREMLAFQKMHDAVSARPASENPLRLALQAVLDELTDAAIDMEGDPEERAAGVRIRLHDALTAGNHLDGAKAAAAEIRRAGLETELTPATWARLQDQIARENDRARRAMAAEVQVTRAILSALHGGNPASVPDGDLREAVEALCLGRITRDQAQRIRDAINEARMI
jgi:hypothetical protein